MCRHDVNLTDYEGKTTKNKQWNLIDIDNEEYIKECNMLFKNAFSDFIGSSK